MTRIRDFVITTVASLLVCGAFWLFLILLDRLVNV